MLCVYCAREFDNKEFSKEHVLPKALGGNINDRNPFLLKSVCKRCNNLSGLYIDGPFIRSWIINNHRASNLHDYAHIDASPALPLIYMGYLKHRILQTHDCEVWMAPAGNTVFHFHEPYPIEDNFWALGRPKGKKNIEIDRGFAFIMISSTNPIWYPTVFNSIFDGFENTTLYIGNRHTYITGAPRISVIPDDKLFIQDEILELMKGHLKINFRHYIDYDQRFMAKFALGMGCIHLNDFIQSEDAERLRQYMWEESPEKRAEYMLRGKPTLKEMPNAFNELMSWPPGHTILLMPIGKTLIVCIYLFGQMSFIMEVSRKKAQWAGVIDSDGIAYFVSPSNQRALGPISYAEYLAVKTDNYINDDIITFLSKYGAKPAQPPFNIQ